MKLLHFTSLVLIATALGCGGHGSHDSSSGSSGADYRLKAATKILSNSGGYVLVSQDDTTVVLQGSVPKLAPGDTFVSQLGEGAVRHVVSVATSGDVTTIHTSPAALTDAFSKLDFQLAAFGKDQLGDIPATADGVSFEWIGADKHARDGGVGQVLRVKFGDASFSSSVKVSGSADVALNPVLKGSLINGTFDYGISPQFTGSLTISSEFGGSLQLGEHKWLDKYFKPFALPECPFVLVFPHLIISSEISGTASSKLSSTYTLNATAKSVHHYARGAGWTDDNSAVDATGAVVAEAEGGFGLAVVPLKAELRFDIMGVAGPYGRLQSNIKAEGVHQVDTDGKEGIEASVNASISGEIGGGVNPDLEELFDFTVEKAYTFDSPDLELFKKFFPFNGAGSIVVADNGTAADDVFAVSLDGTSLGSTDKGGSGQFRVQDLAPGTHSLLVTCTDDGANGADVGTLGITLNDGLTFADGSASYSGDLDLGQSVTLSINVPASKSQGRRATVTMPRNKAIEHPRRG